MDMHNKVKDMAKNIAGEYDHLFTNKEKFDYDQITEAIDHEIELRLIWNQDIAEYAFEGLIDVTIEDGQLTINDWSELHEAIKLAFAELVESKKA